MTDEQLVALAQQSDAQAVSELIVRYIPLVRFKASGYIGPGYEPEDLAQEGFIGLLGAIRTFDSTRDSLFRTYATVCITNRMNSAVKGAGGEKHKALQNYLPLSEMNEQDCRRSGELDRVRISDPENLVIMQEDLDERRSRMRDLLSIFEQETLKLYLSGHSYYEIAQLLQCATKAVDNALQRVRRKLRSII